MVLLREHRPCCLTNNTLGACQRFGSLKTNHERDLSHFEDGPLVSEGTRISYFRNLLILGQILFFGGYINLRNIFTVYTKEIKVSIEN